MILLWLNDVVVIASVSIFSYPVFTYPRTRQGMGCGRSPLVTGTGRNHARKPGYFTVTVSTADLPPACTCTTPEPAFTPITSPVPVTATASSSDHHVTVDAPDGTFTADNCTVEPLASDSFPSETPSPEIDRDEDGDAVSLSSFCSIATACARDATSDGPNFPLPYPEATPFDTTHDTDDAYHAPDGTSENDADADEPDTPRYRAKFRNIAAACPRDTISAGPNLPLPYPDTTPYAAAHDTCLAYQADTGTSENDDDFGVLYDTAFASPSFTARLYSNATICARDTESAGPNLPSPYPDTTPFEAAQSTDDAYHAPDGTSENR